jgi:hypothetical protein
MTARMYYENDAESSGQWRRGAPPWASEGERRFGVEVAGSGEAGIE